MADEQTTGQQTAADTAATQQNPSAEGSAARTFTQEEVDAIVKRRIDKQNVKHATELDGLRERIQELEEGKKSADAELEAIKAASQLADWKAKASAETGVPADLLRGETEEEVMEHAKSIKAVMPKAPSFRDSGKPAPEAGGGAKESFAKFMQDNFS